MPAVLTCPTCPICRAWIAPRAATCPSCHAERQQRRFMSPDGFLVYAAVWLLCSAVLMALAVRIAAVPWVPSGEVPEYALWLLGAADAKPAPACRVTVRDLAGNLVVTSTADACEGMPAALQPAAKAAPSAPDPQRAALLRSLASGLHSALALSVGVLVCWLLRNGLRRLFRRPSGFAWVSQRAHRVERVRRVERARA